MTRCDECVHWEPFNNLHNTGKCGLTLPPFVQAMSPFTTPNMGCDLGTPKEEA